MTLATACMSNTRSYIPSSSPPLSCSPVTFICCSIGCDAKDIDHTVIASTFNIYTR